MKKLKLLLDLFALLFASGMKKSSDSASVDVQKSQESNSSYWKKLSSDLIHFVRYGFAR